MFQPVITYWSINLSATSMDVNVSRDHIYSVLICLIPQKSTNTPEHLVHLI